MLSHVLIINMTYVTEDPMFDIRLEWFKNEVLPKILAQTDQNFDLAIKCNPAHADKVRAVHDKIVVFHETNWDSINKGDIVFSRCSGKYQVRKFSKWKDIVGLKQYDIQSGLDSDDFIAPNYIEKIKEEVMKTDMTQSLHIHFQPEAIDTNGNIKTCKRARYGPKKGSAFYSIYQPDKTNYIFLRDDSHIRMPYKCKKTILIPEGYCWIMCNKNNYGTRLGWL